MEGPEVKLFSEGFQAQLQSLVANHHTRYPRMPPRDVFFESLVEQAFRRCGWSRDKIILSTPNRPQYDLTVGRVRLSIKSETGTETKEDLISITKLCATDSLQMT
jgi:hypothetical protein